MKTEAARNPKNRVWHSTQKGMCYKKRNKSIQFTKRLILPFSFHPEVASKGRIAKKSQRGILTAVAKNLKGSFLSEIKMNLVSPL